MVTESHVGLSSRDMDSVSHKAVNVPWNISYTALGCEPWYIWIKNPHGIGNRRERQRTERLRVLVYTFINFWGRS